MKKLFTLFVSAFLFAGVSSASAAEYDISLDIDGATAGDVQIVSDFAMANTAGTAINGSLRRIIAAVLSEASIAAEGRLDIYDAITLDGGNTITLLDGDVVNAKIKSTQGGVDFCNPTGETCIIVQLGLNLKCALKSRSGKGCLEPKFIRIFANGEIRHTIYKGKSL